MMLKHREANVKLNLLPISRRIGMFVVAAALQIMTCACVELSPSPFRNLADAYIARDATAAALNYTYDATVIYAYDGVPEEILRGRPEIEESFNDFFGQIDPALPLDLNFRIARRHGASLSGYYRLRFGDAENSYGGFDVVQNSDGLFVRDRSTSATRKDFEETAAPLLVRPEANVLDRGYYGLLTGRYRLPDGCALVVTRSIVRIFVRNTCDQSWRGLERVSGLEWTGGDQVLPQTVSANYQFAAIDETPSKSVQVATGGVNHEALRDTPYVTEDVKFTASDGTPLAGTLYLPRGRAGKFAATVLVHGSGPQDRDGYASIIAVLADALAAEGRVVLTYDKRGNGGSGGNGANASFDVLAGDARAAMNLLSTRTEVDRTRIGLAGSSQAGWVVAKAIEMGAKPRDVFLLGAAGAAFTVREQNLYNTNVRMECAGIPEDKRRLALEQQTAFFNAVADRSWSPKLDTLTRSAAKEPAIRDWLFPGSDGLEAENAWFTVLDPTFDPLPVWQSYRGRAVFLFSEYDDSTDTAAALERLKGLQVTALKLPNAQHLGLDANSLCDGELSDRQSFTPALFSAIKNFAAER